MHPTLVAIKYVTIAYEIENSVSLFVPQSFKFVTYNYYAIDTQLFNKKQPPRPAEGLLIIYSSAFDSDPYLARYSDGV